MSFSYTLKKEQDNILVIDLSGRLIEKNQAAELLGELETSIESGTLNLVVNLEGMSYMNSTGLNVLITLLTRARKSGGEAILANEPESIKKLLVITKLNQIFVVADTVKKALEQLRTTEK